MANAKGVKNKTDAFAYESQEWNDYSKMVGTSWSSRWMSSNFSKRYVLSGLSSKWRSSLHSKNWKRWNNSPPWWLWTNSQNRKRRKKRSKRRSLRCMKHRHIKFSVLDRQEPAQREKISKVLMNHLWRHLINHLHTYLMYQIYRIKQIVSFSINLYIRIAQDEIRGRCRKV